MAWKRRRANSRLVDLVVQGQRVLAVRIHVDLHGARQARQLTRPRPRHHMAGGARRGSGHDRAAHIAVRTVTSFLRTSPDIAEVIFCCFSEESAEAHRTALGGTG